MASPALRLPAGTGVLLVAHGSRHPDAPAGLDRQRLLVAQRATGPVGAGFLDLAQPDAVDEGRRLVVEEGVRRLVLAPLLLTTAFHAREDVPVLAAALQATPGAAGVEVLSAPTLGPDPDLLAHASALLARAAAASRGGGAAVGAGASSPVADDAALVVCVGTSDADERARLVAAASGAATRAGFGHHGVAFAAGHAPAPAAEGERLLAAGARRLVVLSWTLLPGLLEDAARCGLAEVVTTTGGLVDAGRLGPSEVVADVVVERVRTAVDRAETDSG